MGKFKLTELSFVSFGRSSFRAKTLATYNWLCYHHFCAVLNNLKVRSPSFGSYSTKLQVMMPWYAYSTL